METTYINSDAISDNIMPALVCHDVAVSIDLKLFHCSIPSRNLLEYLKMIHNYVKFLFLQSVDPNKLFRNVIMCIFPCQWLLRYFYDKTYHISSVIR